MTVLAEVKVLMADKCHCEFSDTPLAHDRLLGIETMGVPYAAGLVADLISDIDPGTGNEGGLLSDPDDFGRFVAQHNWADPVGMAALAESVDIASNQTWPWRMQEAAAGRPVSR